MQRFLRLFPKYRDMENAYNQSVEYSHILEARCNEAASARIAAEDDARFWKSRADLAEAETLKAKEESLTSIKKVANFEALRSGMFTVPFPEVYTAPPQPTENTEDSESPVLNTARARQQAAVQRSRADARDRRRKFRESLDLGDVTESTLNPTTN